MIPDVLALTGDAVDNIPGVEGVGPKTAAKLVREHGSVAKLADDPSVIKNDKLRDKVASASDRVRLNLELVRLDDDLPLPVPVADLGIRPDPGAVLEVARRCEFRSLLAEYEKLVAADASKQGELF
jgi:DNA polymerase-1